MSVLDVFYILFKSDTSDLEKGQKQSAKSTQDLEEKVRRTNAETQALSISFLDLAEKAAAALGVVVGIGAAVKSAFSSEQQALQIGMVAKQLGMNANAIDAMSLAQKRFGGSTESTIANIKRMKENLTFLTPYGGAGDFTPMPTEFSTKARQFGLNIVPGDTPEKAYNKINQLFQGLDAAKSNLIGEKLGLSSEEILMLQETTDQYEKTKNYAKELAAINNENAADVFEFYQNWQLVSTEVRNIGISLAGPILKGLSALIVPSKEIKEDMRELGWAVESVAAGFVVVATVAAAFGKVGMISVIGRLAVSFWGLAAAVIGATWPILLIILAVAAMWAIFHYGPAILDKLGAKFGAVFKDMMDWTKKMGLELRDLFGWFGKVGKAFEALFSGGSIKDRVKAFRDAMKGADTAGADNSKVYGPDRALFDANRAINRASSTPIGSQSNTSILNNGGASNTTSVHIGEVNVQTQATDADGIASNVASGLNRHINNALNNFNTSIVA